MLRDWDEIKAKMFPEADSSILRSGLMDKNSEFESDVKEVVPLKQLKTRAGEHIETKVVAHVLNIAGGNKVKAARILNISYKAVFYEMKNLGLR